MASTFSLHIPAGTKVLARTSRNGSQLVTLQGDVYVTGARHTPENGGGYEYSVGGREYYAADGLGMVAHKEQPAEEEVWSHPHGLVTFRAP